MKAKIELTIKVSYEVDTEWYETEDAEKIAAMERAASDEGDYLPSLIDGEADTETLDVKVELVP